MNFDYHSSYKHLNDWIFWQTFYLLVQYNTTKIMGSFCHCVKLNLPNKNKVRFTNKYALYIRICEAQGSSQILGAKWCN